MSDRCRCSATVASTGKRCKRKVADSETLCHLHLRHQRKVLEESRQQQSTNVVRFPHRQHGAPVEAFDPSEQVGYALEVAHGSRFYTQKKITGGDGQVEEIEVYPTWGERAKFLDLAFRMSGRIDGKEGGSKDQLKRDLAEMLGLELAE